MAITFEEMLDAYLGMWQRAAQAQAVIQQLQQRVGELEAKLAEQQQKKE